MTAEPHPFDCEPDWHPEEDDDEHDAPAQHADLWGQQRLPPGARIETIANTGSYL